MLLGILGSDFEPVLRSREKSQQREDMNVHRFMTSSENVWPGWRDGWMWMGWMALRIVWFCWRFAHEVFQQKRDKNRRVGICEDKHMMICSTHFNMFWNLHSLFSEAACSFLRVNNSSLASKAEPKPKVAAPTLPKDPRGAGGASRPLAVECLFWSSQKFWGLRCWTG